MSNLSSTVQQKVQQALQKALGLSASVTTSLVPDAIATGKLYEAYILALVCDRLKTLEHCSLSFVGGPNLTLKSSPGPINKSYAHVKVTKNGVHIADIWTDVEFTSLSFHAIGSPPPSLGDYHELDIAITVPDADSRPNPHQVLAAIECKHTSYQKSFLRETLGLRRELSLLQPAQTTAFQYWPTNSVPAAPASCVLVFSTDRRISQYNSPGQFFGISFLYEPL